MDVPVYGGFSGSAVHDAKDGSIIGIISGASLSPIVGPQGEPLPLGSNALGYAVPLWRLTGMLDEAKAKYRKVQRR